MLDNKKTKFERSVGKIRMESFGTTSRRNGRIDSHNFLQDIVNLRDISGALTPISASRKKAEHKSARGGFTFGGKPMGFFLHKVLLPLLLLFFVGCAEMPVYREEVFYPKIKQPAVTVKLLETEENIIIAPKESFVIRCFNEKGGRAVYYASDSIRVGVWGEGIVLSEGTQNEFERDLNKVSFLPQKDDSYLFLNGKPYRGALEVVLGPKNLQGKNPKSLLVLNIVYVEDYLKGVVPAEIGKLSDQEIEALKAQAVAARTYSLSRLGQYENLGYDLEASVVDQIYTGAEGENPLVNEAIEDTKGKVLAFGEKLIHAYYHANCGGRTEYIERVWDKPQEPYLISVDDDNFCSWAKNYSWEETWSKEDLEKNLSAFLDSIGLLPKDGSTMLTTRGFGNLVDLIIKERSLSGRIEVLEVVTDSGTYQIYRDKIRWALKRGSDPNLILPSTLFDLEIERGFDNSIESIIARGHGNGHGVGMCQTGAIGMARKGYSHEDILTHYYPGVNIVKSY